MSTVFTEGRHAGEHLVSEANGNLSRDVVTVTGGDYAPGTVLGQITASKKFTQLAPSASDGSQNAVAILFDTALAASADVSQVVHARSCEVNDLCLTWPAGITDSQKATALAALVTKQIIVRA